MRTKMKEKWEMLQEKWFEGDITLPKVTLWLACTVCLFAGIVYGLKKAPWTHGVTIASNNGNNNGNNSGNGLNDGTDEEKTQEEEEQEEERGIHS